MPTKDKRPTQVWAVEYTTVERRRHVAVMDSADDAQQWIDNLNRSGVEANPILLHSDARFTHVDAPSEAVPSMALSGRPMIGERKRTRWENALFAIGLTLVALGVALCISGF